MTAFASSAIGAAAGYAGYKLLTLTQRAKYAESGKFGLVGSIAGFVLAGGAGYLRSHDEGKSAWQCTEDAVEAGVIGGFLGQAAGAASPGNPVLLKMSCIGLGTLGGYALGATHDQAHAQATQHGTLRLPVQEHSEADPITSGLPDLGDMWNALKQTFGGQGASK